MNFTDQNVHDIIASGKPVVIDFWATWCGPCQRMTPIVEELAEQYKDSAVIGKYNIEEENDLTTEFRIMSIPTILFFKNGEQVRDLRLAGAQPKEKLEEQIKNPYPKKVHKFRNHRNNRLIFRYRKHLSEMTFCCFCNF